MRLVVCKLCSVSSSPVSLDSIPRVRLILSDVTDPGRFIEPAFESLADSHYSRCNPPEQREQDSSGAVGESGVRGSAVADVPVRGIDRASRDPELMEAVKRLQDVEAGVKEVAASLEEGISSLRDEISSSQDDTKREITKIQQSIDDLVDGDFVMLRTYDPQH